VRTHAKATSAIAALCCAVVFCLCASQALAAKGVVGFVGGAGTQGGQFGNSSTGPGGAAVNLSGTGGASAGDLYVADRNNNRVQQFHADGTWVRTFGVDVIEEGKPNDVSTTAFEICDSTAATLNVPADCKGGTIVGAPGQTAGGMRAPQGVAVEQATGNLYVTDQTNRRVDVYSATGAFQGAFGWNVKVTGSAPELQLCTTATGCKVATGTFAEANAGQFGTAIGYPAINPANGHILIANRSASRVDEFEATITAGAITGIAYVRGYGWKVNKEAPAEAFQTCTTATGCQAASPGSGTGQFMVNSPTAVSADSTGRVYVLDFFNNRVQAFSAALSPEGEFAAAKLSGEPRPVDLGVDPASNHLLATKPCTALACPGALVGEQRVQELDAAGNTVQTWAEKASIPSSTGLAIGSGAAYMTTKEGGPSGKPGFFVLGDPVPPAVSIDPVTTFTGTTATFEGKVTTDTIAVSYHFEYSPDGSTWTRLPAKAGEDKSVAGDNAEHTVSANVTGLEALTEYQVRLVANKAYAGGSAQAQTSFTTASAPPVLSGFGHSRLRDTSAQLDATINPENEETEYHFEYVDQAGFEAEGFVGATSVPVPPGQLSGGKAIEVHVPISGLEPFTTYRYRLLASNGTGGVESSVGSFTTYASAQVFDSCPNDNLFRINKPAATLPDCRAYEQATPVNKNGGNVQSEYSWTKASPSGHRVSFEAVAGLPGGEGSQNFPTYVATRAGEAWSTQGVLPAAPAGQKVEVLGWTPDFAQVFSWALKFGEGTALLSRSSADGSLATIAPYDKALSNSIAIAGYLGASADGSTVFVGIRPQLPVAAGSPTPAPTADQGKERGEANLYAWDRETGELYLAGVLPDGTAPSGGGSAGGLYIGDTDAVTADGSLYFTDLETGQLYRRLNPTEPETANKDGKGNCVPDPVLACTVHVSASEKDDGGGLEGHDSAGSQATKFTAAGKDGSKAIFTSSEKLTNDAYTGFEPDPAAIARANVADGTGKDLGFLPTFADAIDVEGEYVYWTDPDNDRIGRAKLDKSLYEPDFITSLSNLKGLAVIDEPGAQYIFWTSPTDGEWENSPITGEGKIGRADLEGNDVEPNCLEGVVNPNGIDVDSGHVYWTSPDPNEDDHRGPSGRANLVCEETSIEPEFIPQPNKGGADIAVTDDYIYVSGVSVGFDFGVIWRFNIDGTGEGFDAGFNEAVFAFGTEVPPGLAVDGSHFYWTNPATSEIGRSDLDGTEVSRESGFITAAGHPSGLAVDASHAYWSANQEATPNAGSDLYSYDSEAPVNHRLADLAPEHDGENGIEVQGVLGVSEDVSYVYFVANGVPDAGVSNSPNANGEEVVAGNCEGNLGFEPSGVCNLYLAYEGEVTFIAQMDAKTASSGESTSDAANWIANAGQLGLSGVREKTARVSAEGRTLLFRSQRQLTPYDNQGPECVQQSSIDLAPGPCTELYRYRVGEPGLVCVSCNPTGAPPAGPVGMGSIETAQVGASPPAPVLSRNLSADGDRVFFETRDALVAADSNGDENCAKDAAYFHAIPSCQDVYEWEAAGTGSCPESAGPQGCIYLLSTGANPHPSFFGDASASGDDAFIFTFSQLVRQDEDALLDVYDARAEGGLISQDAIPPVPCEGEACKAGTSTSPAAESAGTASFSASGNPPAVHKKANKKKKRRRQAKKKHHKKRHSRAAGKTGRASR
jgi:virginiamycin B lyase